MTGLMLACYAWTFALCDAKLLAVPRARARRIRFIDEMLGCYFCTGMWVSLGLAGLVGHRGTEWFVMGSAGATFSYLTNTVILALERWTDG